jgi:hypothetical protein
MISDELDLGSGFAIDTFTTATHPPRVPQAGGAVVESKPVSWLGAPARLAYAENEVPQPHDFVELGFTNTNPCCIRVS